MAGTTSGIAEALLSAEAEVERLKEALANAEEKEESEKPKEIKRFRHTVQAYGHFYSHAYDAYEADEQAREMSRADILTCIENNGGWEVTEVNDDELPEEY